MSDLNQMVKRVKSGWDLKSFDKKIIQIIENYKKSSGRVPICCFYVCPAEDVPEALLLDGFKNYAESSEEQVVGCSRGCLPSVKIHPDGENRFYAEKLCEECVKDAQNLLKGEVE